MEGVLSSCLVLWWCCLQPVAAFQVGVFITRHGGVRASIHYLLDRMGVPRLE